MTSSHPEPSTSSFTTSGAHLAFLALLSLVLVGYNLGANSLHNQDEAKHAVVAREAATDGHWIPLTYNGRPYYSKPPLRIWLTALSFKVGGINEWTVRLWSGLFAAATVLMLYLAGCRIYNRRIAFWGSLILLTSHQYLYNHCARSGETDSMLIFGWTGGLLLLQLAVQERNRRLLFGAAALIGLCGMVKHLAFVPLLVAIAVGYIFLSGSWKAFSARAWITSLSVILAVALPWHLLMWALEGRAFIDAYFLGEVVEGRLQAAAGDRAAARLGLWAPLRTLANGFFPWSFLLPFALLSAIRDREARRRWLQPILWLLVAMAMTMISGRKYTWYVLPAFPAAALLVAGLIDRYLGDRDSRFAQVSIFAGSLLAFASITNAATENPFAVKARLTMLSVRFLGRFRDPLSTEFGILAVAVVLVACLVWFSRSTGRSPGTRYARLMTRPLLVGAMLVLALYTVTVPLKFSRTRSPLHQMSIAIREHLRDTETLTVLLPSRKSRNPSFNYYFGEQPLQRLSAAPLNIAPAAGRLVLTDWATLREIRKTQPGLDEPDLVLEQARGLLLLRWPES